MQDNSEFKVYSFDGEESIDDFSSVLHDLSGNFTPSFEHSGF